MTTFKIDVTMNQNGTMTIDFGSVPYPRVFIAGIINAAEYYNERSDHAVIVDLRDELQRVDESITWMDFMVVSSNETYRLPKVTLSAYGFTILFRHLWWIVQTCIRDMNRSDTFICTVNGSVLFEVSSTNAQFNHHLCNKQEFIRMYVTTTEHDQGQFTLSQSVMRVTDPCYTRGTWCSGNLDALPGTWHASYTTESSEGRVASLIVRHSSVAGISLGDINEKTDIDVGVDSGQAGFFDDEFYPHDENEFEYESDTFYGICCEASGGDCIVTLPNSGNPVNVGAVTSSGYGDGGYNCYVSTVNGVVVAAKIVFIDELDYDEYEDEYEDDDMSW